MVPSGVVAATIPDYVVGEPLKMACRQSLKRFGDAPKCADLKQFRLFCRGDSGQSSRDLRAHKKPASADQAQAVSAGNKDCTCCWTPVDVCYVLGESLSSL